MGVRGRKITTEEFVKIATEIHKGKYDYSLSEYINSYTKVKIICPDHGVFEQRPDIHTSGSGCTECSLIKQSKDRIGDYNSFVTKAINIHGDKYDYSKVNYINSRIKVIIICPIHGESEQMPVYHLRGSGCKKCGVSSKRPGRMRTMDSILKDFSVTHGVLYDYSLVDYTGIFNKVKIICKTHGIFEQTPDNHIRGTGCPICCNIERSEIHSDNLSDFINKANNRHVNKYDYSLVDYKGTSVAVKIICPKHGVFEQLPNGHLSGAGCPRCNSSKGEIKIMKFLNNINLLYEEQKKFKDCKNKNPLPFDFYLPEYNICIEYDGEQHYIPKSFSSDNSIETKQKNLENIQKRDKIKTDYCIKNNIKLIRISYWDLNNISEILTQELCLL